MDGLRLILIIAGIIVLALVYFFSRRSQQDQPLADEESLQEDTEWMEEIAKQRRKLTDTKGQPPADEPLPDAPVLDDVQITTPDETVAPAWQAEAEQNTIQADTVPEPETELTREDTASPPQQEEKIAEPPAEDTTAPVEPPLVQEEQAIPPASPEELIVVLHITAPQEMAFVGANLFSALEEIGLRFGEGGIFHYCHAQPEQGSKDAVLFSVANILEPGTFEGGQMEQEFTTPGIVMFMRAPGTVPARNMVETLLLKAQQLAQLLGGEIRDEARDLLSESTIKSLLDQATAFDSAAKH